MWLRRSNASTLYGSWLPLLAAFKLSVKALDVENSGKVKTYMLASERALHSCSLSWKCQYQ